MADEEAGAKKSGGGILPLINMVLLVLVLGVGGFVAWKIMQLDQAPSAGDKAPAKTEDTTLPEADSKDNPDAPPIFIDMADVTVNLADTETSRFLRAKIKLEVHGEEDKAKVEASMVQINDLVITDLASKEFKNIRSPQGKYKLKEELIYRINKLIGGKPVKGFYFTEFVSQ